MGGGGDAGAELDQTPTWAVAVVVAVIILISILLENFISLIEEWLEGRRKPSLLEALEIIKEELMVLGFISLFLTFTQNYIASICIPEELSITMLPCPNRALEEEEGGYDGRRRLMFEEEGRRLGGDIVVECEEGNVPLITIHALHQLHIFIFFLAIFHVMYSAITMKLGRAKIRGWKEWEKLAVQEQNSADDSAKLIAHQTSFVKSHTGALFKSPITFYMVCFLRQFFAAVTEADYLILRHAFVTVHLGPKTNFDFQKYIKRSLEDDFKVVVGISESLWFLVVVFMLVNTYENPINTAISLLPLMVLLSVGTKLQAIMTKMALEIKQKHSSVQGIPLVEVSDALFWLGWPRLILHLIHYVLFANAFELTYVIWILYEFGLNACFHKDKLLLWIRVVSGVGAQIVCSYITLPLYALVTQMGSNMKKSIFDDQTSNALIQWHTKVKRKGGLAGFAAKKALNSVKSTIGKKQPAPANSRPNHGAESSGAKGPD